MRAFKIPEPWLQLKPWVVRWRTLADSSLKNATFPSYNKAIWLWFGSRAAKEKVFRFICQKIGHLQGQKEPRGDILVSFHHQWESWKGQSYPFGNLLKTESRPWRPQVCWLQFPYIAARQRRLKYKHHRINITLDCSLIPCDWEPFIHSNLMSFWPMSPV